ncbi:MAG: hypothetical protein AB7U71_23780 [Comamonas sp.]
MRYSTEQLLLTSKVRELAVKLAAEAFERDKKKAFGAKSDSDFLDFLESGEFDEWQSTWRENHPMEDFLQGALDRLESAADFIFQSPRTE